MLYVSTYSRQIGNVLLQPFQESRWGWTESFKHGRRVADDIPLYALKGATKEV